MAQHSVEPLAPALTRFVRALADQSEDEMVSGRLFLVHRYFGFSDAIGRVSKLRDALIRGLLLLSIRGRL